MSSNSLPSTTFSEALRSAPVPEEALPNPFEGRSIYVCESVPYDLYRSMLYALGAKTVSNRMGAGLDQILHAGPIPSKVSAKYPSAERARADAVLPLFRQRVPSLKAYLDALEAQGFTVRNRSDEGDPDLRALDVPLVDGSLHATLLRWLESSSHLRGYCRKQHFPIEQREAAFREFTPPGAEGWSWYYAWDNGAFHHVTAERDDGPYPLLIKGPDLMSVLPVFYKEITGMYVYEYPHRESITGLFVVAGTDARTGAVTGVTAGRVWT